MEIKKRSARVASSLAITLAIMVAVSYLAYLAEKGYIDIVGAQAHGSALVLRQGRLHQRSAVHRGAHPGLAYACRQPGNPAGSAQARPGRKPAHGAAFPSCVLQGARGKNRRIDPDGRSRRCRGPDSVPGQECRKGSVRRSACCVCPREP